jgi:transposase-like protein
VSTSTQSTLSLPDLPGIEPGWELLNLREPAVRGKFTGEQLAANEEKLAAVLSALGEGLGTRQIARAFKISPNTVLRISRKFGEQIETLKESIGRDCLDVARLAVERMRDEIDEMPRASLPIVAGIMIERGQLLTGAPTARIEHDHKHTVADVADFIDSLPSVTPVISEKANDQKAIGAPVDLTALEVVDPLPDDADRDSQSLDSAQSPEVSPKVSADVGQIPAEKKEAT